MIGDLHREFARGNEHEGGDSQRFVMKKFLHNRNEEGKSLARTGLRGGKHVLAGEGLRDRRTCTGVGSENFAAESLSFM